MRRYRVCLMFVSLVLLSVTAAYSGQPAAFTQEKATVTLNGTDTYGQVFVRTDDPVKLLVLAGDAAFLVDRGAKTVHDVAVNSINDKSDPVMIDYAVLSTVEGAGLIVNGGQGVAFLAKGDRYEVKLQDRGYLGPE